jgi:hypothetical protein
MKVVFETEKEITVVSPRTKKFTELVVNSLTDSPSEKTVKASINGMGNVTLWSGAEYDAIGQWTDTDVVTKLNQIYG